MTLTMHEMRRRFVSLKNCTGSSSWLEGVKNELIVGFEELWDYARRLEQARDADNALRCRLEHQLKELQDKVDQLSNDIVEMGEYER